MVEAKALINLTEYLSELNFHLQVLLYLVVTYFVTVEQFLGLHIKICLKLSEQLTELETVPQHLTYQINEVEFQ